MWVRSQNNQLQSDNTFLEFAFILRRINLTDILWQEKKSEILF